MSNPILEGIMAGAGLAQRSAQMRQDRFNSQVKADQFDRSHRLDRDIFSETKYKDRRGENIKLARSSYNSLNQLIEQGRELTGEDAAANEKNMQDLFTSGMSNPEFKKSVEAGGAKVFNTNRAASATNTKGDIPFDKLAGSVAPKTYTRSDGVVIEEGEQVFTLGGTEGQMTNATNAEDTAPDNSGVPFAMRGEELLAVLQGGNEYIESQGVEQSRYDTRVEKEFDDINKLSDIGAGANSDVRASYDAVTGHAANRPQTLSGGAPAAGDGSVQNTRAPDIFAADDKAEIVAKNQKILSDLDAGKKTLKEGEVPGNPPTETAFKALTELYATDPTIGKAAIEKELSFFKDAAKAQKEKAQKTEKGFFTDDVRNTERDLARTYQDRYEQLETIVKAKPAVAGLADRANIKTKVEQGTVTPEDVATHKQQMAAWKAEGVKLKKKYNSDITAAEKASTAVRRAHLAAIVKLKIPIDGKTVTTIMNDGRTDLLDLARTRAYQQRTSNMSSTQRGKYNAERQKGIDSFIKRQKAGVDRDYNEKTFQAWGMFDRATRRAVEETDMTEADAAAISDAYVRYAQWAPNPETTNLSINFGKVATELEAADLIGGDDFKGQDGFDRLTEYTRLAESIAAGMNKGKNDGEAVTTASGIMSYVTRGVADARGADPKADVNGLILNEFKSFGG